LGALFAPAIGYFKAARSLALDDDVAVPLAQFDLADVAARAVNLLCNQSRALPALELFALRDVAAPMDAESSRLGIEVGVEHWL